MAAGYAIGAASSRRRPHIPRAALLFATAAAHGAAILLLLARGDVIRPPVGERILAVFDVPPPKPRPSTPRVRAVEAVRVNDGGSAGRQRERPATPRSAAPLSLDATIVADAMPLSSATLGIDAAAIDLGGTGTADGGGTEGTGTGAGSGPGSDADEADFTRYSRAEWIKRPVTADFLRVWPTHEVDGRRVRRQGWAYLACSVPENGRPDGCTVVREYPTGAGMGRAAIAVAGRTRVRPVRRDDAALRDVPVLIPVVFDDSRVRRPAVTSAASVPRAR